MAAQSNNNHHHEDDDADSTTRMMHRFNERLLVLSETTGEQTEWEDQQTLGRRAE